jgi:hypothetical protein
MGFDGFIWFVGVVEDNNDPDKLGRIKVRCLGLHTEDKNELPTEDLPWATPMMPVTSASLSQIGNSPTGLLNGSWVMGFFRDGEECQEPVIMGSFHGYPTEKPNTDLGFCDPKGVHPTEIDEQDTSRLSRGDTRSAIYRKYLDGINEGHRDDTAAEDDESGRGLKSVANKPIAWGGSWQASPISYNARYPYNRVTQTESGHVIELDDTPNSERIMIFHRKDTFVEFQPDGSIRIHSFGKGELLVDLDLNIECKSDINIYCHGNTNVYSDKNINMESQSDVQIKCKNFKVDASNTVDVDAGSNIDMDAPRIDLN